MSGNPTTEILITGSLGCLQHFMRQHNPLLLVSVYLYRSPTDQLNLLGCIIFIVVALFGLAGCQLRCAVREH